MPTPLSFLNLFDILADAIAIALMASEGIVFIFISISTQRAITYEHKTVEQARRSFPPRVSSSKSRSCNQGVCMEKRETVKSLPYSTTSNQQEE